MHIKLGLLNKPEAEPDGYADLIDLVFVFLLLLPNDSGVSRIFTRPKRGPPLRSLFFKAPGHQVTFFHEKIKTTQVTDTGRFFKLSRLRGRPQNGRRSRKPPLATWASFTVLPTLPNHSGVSRIFTVLPTLPNHSVSRI